MYKRSERWNWAYGWNHFNINYEDTAIILDGEVADFENLLDAVNNDAKLYAEIISDSKKEILKIYVTTRH